tara:strand:+ start:440 stop:769 length:330 start_codon:yes stop_codon:yes gene_type:complete
MSGGIETRNINLCYNNEDQVSEFCLDTDSFPNPISEKDVIVGNWEVPEKNLEEIVNFLLMNMDSYVDQIPNKLKCDLKNEYGIWGMRSHTLKRVIDKTQPDWKVIREVS